MSIYGSAVKNPITTIMVFVAIIWVSAEIYCKNHPCGGYHPRHMIHILRRKLVQALKNK